MRMLSSNKRQSSSESKFFDNLVDRKGLAERIGLSPSYISYLMKHEGLPYFKIGRSVRFQMEEVSSWLQKRRYP